MRRHEITASVVDGERLVGIVTNRDLALRDKPSLPVKNVMTTQV